jgi:hypothetical protein
LNEVTGKESNSGTAFSDLNWGKATRDYLVSVRGLKQKTLATILEMALDVYNKTDSKRSKSLAVSQDDLDDEPGWRANLVDLSDDGDCKRHPTFQSFPTVLIADLTESVTA